MLIYFYSLMLNHILLFDAVIEFNALQNYNNFKTIIDISEIF